MFSCVFPGSFDPVTKGHLEIIRRASSLFEHVTVTVMINIHKSGIIAADKRMDLLRKACGGLQNVTVDSWNGLLSEYMKKHHEKIVIRGIRNTQEYDQEAISAAANKTLYNEMETFFIPASPDLIGVSSSAVKEIAAFGGDISAFVPEQLTEEIMALLSKK